jgi:hypothetical protein
MSKKRFKKVTTTISQGFVDVGNTITGSCLVPKQEEKVIFVEMPPIPGDTNTKYCTQHHPPVRGKKNTQHK